MIDQGKLGGRWLQVPQNGAAVIFVHGILSSSEGAWTHPNGAFWPNMLVRQADLEGMGVGVFAYRTDWKARSYSVSDAGDLLREFTIQSGLRTLMFVCHSMGGIVVRRFLVANQVTLIDHKSRIGLFFIASPSLGSSDANKIVWLARMLGNTQAEALRFAEDNVWLNDLDKDFLKLKESGRVPIIGKELIEDEPIRVKKFLGLWTKVVQPFSAARYFSDSLKIPGTDHSSISKPESRESLQHRVLKGFVQNVMMVPPPYLADMNEHETNQAVKALRAIRERLASKGIAEYEVLAAIEEALLETRSYLQRRTSGEPRDSRSEALLSQVWSSAGRSILPYDPQLAELCWVKGHGWADESVWTDPRYKDLPVAVNDMLEKIFLTTRRASGSAQQKGYPRIDIAEGTLQLDTITWRTVVLLPPFSQPPAITLSRMDQGGAGEDPVRLAV